MPPEHRLFGLHGAKGSGKDTFAALASDLLARARGPEAPRTCRFAFGDEMKAVIQILTGKSLDEIEHLKRDEGGTMAGGAFTLPAPGDDRTRRAAQRLCERYGTPQPFGGPARVAGEMSRFFSEFRSLPGERQTMRSLLQQFGTEFARERLAQDIWVRIAINDYRAWLGQAVSGGVDTVAFFTDVRMENEAVALREISRALGVNATLIKIRSASSRSARPDRHVSEAGEFGHLIDVIVENDPAAGLDAYLEKVSGIVLEQAHPDERPKQA